MNTMFGMLAALAVAAALALLLWPLLRAPKSGAVAAQTALLREQLDALKSAHAAGLVSEADFATRQQALSAAALQLIDQPALAKPALSGTARVVAVLLLLGVPAATLVLYEQVGTPNALGFSGPAAPAPAGTGEAASQAAPGLAQAAQTLAAKLRDNPQDGEGWALLARTHRAMEDFAAAAQAYERAIALLPENASLLVEAAESKGLSSSSRTLQGQPEQWVDRAIELEPENQDALFLKGLARAQADDPAAAESTWERLLKLMEPGSESQQAVVAQLNIVRARLGKEALATPAAAAPATAVAPEAPSAPASKAPGIDVTVRLADSLAGRVDADDVLFVFARAEQGPPAPLAIQRLAAAAIPVALRLDETMGMIAGMSLAQFPKVVVGARISKSGNAAPQPGDLEGLSAALDWRAAGRVEIVIDRIR